MKALFVNPMFFIGLSIRFALIVSLSPFAASAWYEPFLDVSTSAVTVDPWSQWIASGGTPIAFPYGFAMWLAFLPMTLMAKLVNLPVHYAYGLTLLAADASLLFTLGRFWPNRRRLLLIAYWLSPIVILATYGLGFNDVIPALLLTIALLFLRRVELKWAGALCAAAISAKLSMGLALPFFAVYLYGNRALRQRFPRFISGFVFSALLFAVPFLLSEAGRLMLFSNPEMDKVYQLAVGLGGDVSIYVVPLVYMVILYLTWWVKRLNFELFYAMAGMAFLVIVLMTPASPGWFIWSIPFLALYQLTSGRTSVVIIGVFSGFYVLSTLLVTPLVFANGSLFELDSALQISGQLGGNAASLLHTSMVGIGILLAIRIWQEAIGRNEFFRLSRKPFVIGIAGDSGSGKDTFANSITGLFGQHSVVRLSGDDYHLWDRQKPIWHVMTHLNPMANDLERFSNDLVSLTNGKGIQSRHYNHEIGKIGKATRIESNDFIITSGLHALYLPILRDVCDLKVFLDIDEGLRHYLKLNRDVHKRGHSAQEVLSSFEQRKPDSERFIRPQSAHADLIFSLQPIHPRMLEELDYKHALRLKLVIRTRHQLSDLSLNRVLIGVCGLHVDLEASQYGSEVKMTVEGESEAADVAIAAQMLCPRVLEFLDFEPEWHDGMTGLMQLVTLSHINQKLAKRFM